MNEHQPPHRGHEADRTNEQADRSRPVHGWHPSMGPAADRFLSTWDAPPRDGPAVFVADLTAHDLLGVMRGRWLDPTQPPKALEAQITEIVGRDGFHTGRWGVLDQLKVGPNMVPEQLSVAALTHWYRTHRHRTVVHEDDLPVRPLRVLRAISASQRTLGNGAES